MAYFLLLFILFHFASFSCPSSHSLNAPVPLCLSQDSSSLLYFKNLFTTNYPQECYYECLDGYPKTTTWENGTDCCSWLGVTCHPLSGHVTGLDLTCSCLQGEIGPNSTLFRLTHLQSLNLAYNSFSGQLPSQLGGLVSLTHLNLSYCEFQGNIPPQISHLSKLVSLDLSQNDFLELKKTTWKRLLQNATALSEIILDDTNISSVSLNHLSYLANKSSVVALSLASTRIRGRLTSDFLCFSNLQELYLSGNQGIQGHLPILNCTSSLTILDISFCSLQGSIPSSFSNLTHLTTLILSDNNLNGSIPSSFSELQNLVHLDLASNQLTGGISNIFYTLTQLQILILRSNNLREQLPSSLFTLTRLSFFDCAFNKFEGALPNQIPGFSNITTLRLNDNILSGPIPSWCLSLPSLTYLDLSNNLFTGHINVISSHSLTYLFLCNNKLHGNIPESIFNLVYLTQLCLSSNNYTNHVQFSLFHKFQDLEVLSLSGYSPLAPKFESSNVNYSFPRLMELRFSNGLTDFPKFLGNFPNLEYLDLSFNNLQGKVPKWIHDIDSLINLDLSHNLLTSIGQFTWHRLEYLDLSSNLMNDDISSFICNATSIQTINLSNNKLTGVFPRCLVNFSSIEVLDLQMNKLHGTLPNTFSNLKYLKTLNLNSNQLKGLLPKSLSNCTVLVDLNIGNNQIEHTFPNWLQNLASLEILVLGANKLYGPITSLKTKDNIFPSLIIFDISHNNFSGPLPKDYMKNFQGMKNFFVQAEIPSNVSSYVEHYAGTFYYKMESIYDDSLNASIKGVSSRFVKVPTMLALIDLSENKFEGEIPNVIGELHGLKGLNLSHNRLTRSIPLSMGNLTNLEWLDLSSNMLTGEIPNELTNLNFLEVLNLSNNNLVGEIPKGKQFDTFTNDSYKGNMALCGLPLSMQCNSGQQSPPSPTTFEVEDKFGFGWKPVAIGYACGMVFGVALGCCVLWTGKPQCLVRLVRVVPKKRVRIRSRATRHGGNRARIN